MPALAAAVTPIMKLLVVVETLNGMRMAWSMASTFTAPEPMPSKPGQSARDEHDAEAARARAGRGSACGPSGVG